MKNIGLFEAKTKFSEICDAVFSDGEPVLVTRRGMPLVKITPVDKNPVSSTWDARSKFMKAHKDFMAELELPKRTREKLEDVLS